jgi:hypothetical protein
MLSYLTSYTSISVTFSVTVSVTVSVIQVDFLNEQLALREAQLVEVAEQMQHTQTLSNDSIFK